MRKAHGLPARAPVSAPASIARARFRQRSRNGVVLAQKPPVMTRSLSAPQISMGIRQALTQATAVTNTVGGGAAIG
jgi:hypothetical protein